MSRPKNPALVELDYANDGQDVVYRTGITLRDLFAAFAMAAELASPATDPGTIVLGDVAANAYQTADAMLAERERS